MSTYTNLTWPVQDVAAVCPLQNVLATGPTAFQVLFVVGPDHGTLFDSSIPDQVSFVRVNMIRSISLSSVNNLSTTNFIIQGFQNGAFVTETLSGPNNNTVYGTKSYDIITSVTTNTAVNGIKVGTGRVGFLPLLMININAGFINYAMTVLLPPSSGINYSIFQTLDQVSNNFITFSNQVTKFFPVDSNLTNQTTSQTGNSIVITNFILLQVNSSATPVTDTFDFIFLQE